MKLLILGGTVFLGRALVIAAQAHNHEVTLFNRGQSNREAFADVEQLYGNRDGELHALKGRQWDAVIDTCGYVPHIVQQSATLLADKVEHYTFISSISVYADFSQIGIDERYPVGTLADEAVEEVTGETYGPLKALCEQVIQRTLPNRDLIIRPGLIVGPYDPTDRFTYWPYRVAQGGEILVPEHPTRLVQLIDVRDLAEWIIRLIEQRQTGIYNASGPSNPLAMGDLLKACQFVARTELNIHWVSEQFLQQHEVGAWVELPLWIPETETNYAGFNQIACGKAIEARLSYRPLNETITTTLKWANRRPTNHQWRAGLKREREIALLAKWHDY